MAGGRGVHPLLELIAAVGRFAEEQNHHPDLDWRYNRVFIRYTSHDAGGQVTERDAAAAKAAGSVAAEIGAEAQPGLFRTVEIGIDTAESIEIRCGPGSGGGCFGQPAGTGVRLSASTSGSICCE